MIKAVIFDIDGVILDSFEANFKFFSDLMQYSGYPLPTREKYRSLFHFTMKDVIKELTQSSSTEEIEKIFKAGRNRAVPYPFELVQAPQDMRNVVSDLSKRYLLGITTNRIRRNVEEMPPLAALKECFTATVAYEDTVRHKPDPEPLLLTAQKLGIQPAEAVYIGDATSDVIAARAAGMKVIIYNQEPIADAGIQISAFAELPTAIQNL